VKNKSRSIRTSSKLPRRKPSLYLGSTSSLLNRTHRNGNTAGTFNFHIDSYNRNLTWDTFEFTEALPRALSRGLRLQRYTNGSKVFAMMTETLSYNNETSITPISGRSRTRLILGNYLTTESEESSSSVRKENMHLASKVRRQTKRFGHSEREIKRALQALHRLAP
jgi:hypothetical protein